MGYEHRIESKPPQFEKELSFWTFVLTTGYIEHTRQNFQGFEESHHALQSTVEGGPRTLSAMESFVPVPSVSICVDLSGMSAL